MIHDELVSYGVAKLAKEKGFNEGCLFYYQNGVTESDGCYNHYNMGNKNICSAPTQNLLQRWLREEKKWNIVVRMYEDKGYYWFIQNSKGQLQESYFTYADEMFDTYELALDDALKYALENLV